MQKQEGVSSGNPEAKTDRGYVRTVEKSADCISAQHVQGGKQGCGSVADVIVGLPFRDSGTQGQNRLRTIQRLNLALLIHAQQQSLLRRVQVQPYDVVQFVKELRSRS